MISRSVFVGVAVLALSSAGFVGCLQEARDTSAQQPVALPLLEGLDRPVDFASEVKPVLDNRCVVCHACNDAPCQLVLSSHEGAMRGATKQPVYDSARLRAKDPTRLFVDAHGPDAWRAKDFFSVTDGSALLLRMLALGKANPFAAGTKLPESVGLDIDRKLTCAEGGRIRVLRARAATRGHAVRRGAARATTSSQPWSPGSRRARSPPPRPHPRRSWTRR